MDTDKNYNIVTRTPQGVVVDTFPVSTYVPASAVLTVERASFASTTEVRGAPGANSFEYYNQSARQWFRVTVEEV